MSDVETVLNKRLEQIIFIQNIIFIFRLNKQLLPFLMKGLTLRTVTT